MRHQDTLSKQERSARGAHYTPEDLADELVSVALQPHIGGRLPTARCILDLNIVDPACGDGAILQAAVRALVPELIQAMVWEGVLLTPAAASRLIQRCCLIGNDVDQGAVAAARRNLPHARLTCEDSLFVDYLGDSVSGPLVFVGNPPFIGGGKISTMLGQDYRKALVERFPPFRGNGRADLCAAFFLDAAQEVDDRGGVGSISFIATKTISEGDTRLAGLKVLVDDRWVIWDAWQSRPWPGKAKVNIAIVHLMSPALAKREGFS